ncbi:class GN sortase [Marinobacteraceae bacterium S3BR75-40.1]
MRWLIRVLVVAGLVLLVSGLWIPLKAALAQQLLQQAWSETQARGSGVRPWPWADTWPVAQLLLPGQEHGYIVLAGSGHGQSLAFAPTLVTGTLQQEQGLIVIAAHRDTHFRGLKTLTRGATLELTAPSGRQRRYTVSTTRVVDSRRTRLYAASPTDPGPDQLVLVTCYPFDVVSAGGPLRYVVIAEPVPDTASAAPSA